MLGGLLRLYAPPAEASTREAGGTRGDGRQEGRTARTHVGAGLLNCGFNGRILNNMKKIFLNSFFTFFFAASLFISTCEHKFSGKREARGLWVTRWDYTTALDTTDRFRQQGKLREIIKAAGQAGFNFIFFQVRGQADAYYRSKYEPWAAELTGELGKDPGWDPLQYALEYAHALGLELHAWINTFTAWRGVDPPGQSEPIHMYSLHPDWVSADYWGNPMELDTGYVFFSPGIPEVRQHVSSVALDIISNYDVDGIHFDYIRYPERSRIKGYSRDSISLSLFNSEEGNPRQLDWESWQREQITAFLRSFYNEAVSIRPDVKISAAVIGKYKRPGWNGYYEVYQDPIKWLDEGIIDFIVPMIYWRIGEGVSAFNEVAAEWLFLNPGVRPVFPGIAVYKAEGRFKWGWREIWRQVRISRDLDMGGFVFFSSRGLEGNWELIKNKVFPYRSLFPGMPWKDAIPPNPPLNLEASRVSEEAVKLIWEAPTRSGDGDSASYYVVYRSENLPLKMDTAEDILTVVYTNKSIDSLVEGTATYYYAVSAVDKGGNESEISNIVEVTAPFFVKK
ncbi:MAG: glycoside hydrolase family 10 protein [Fidelibacterota bacterium]